MKKILLAITLVCSLVMQGQLVSIAYGNTTDEAEQVATEDPEWISVDKGDSAVTFSYNLGADKGENFYATYNRSGIFTVHYLNTGKLVAKYKMYEYELYDYGMMLRLRLIEGKYWSNCALLFKK